MFQNRAQIFYESYLHLDLDLNPAPVQCHNCRRMTNRNILDKFIFDIKLRTEKISCRNVGIGRNLQFIIVYKKEYNKEGYQK